MWRTTLNAEKNVTYSYLSWPQVRDWPPPSWSPAVERPAHATSSRLMRARMRSSAILWPRRVSAATSPAHHQQHPSWRFQRWVAETTSIVTPDCYGKMLASLEMNIGIFFLEKALFENYSSLLMLCKLAGFEPVTHTSVLTPLSLPPYLPGSQSLQALHDPPLYRVRTSIWLNFYGICSEKIVITWLIGL